MDSAVGTPRTPQRQASERSGSRPGSVMSAVLYAESEAGDNSFEKEQWPAAVDESYSVLESDTSYQNLDKPDANTIKEIVGLLKVKTSMLAVGACERVKKLAKAHPIDVIRSPILDELLHIVEDGPGTPLAGLAMSAMSTMALVPEGRQRIVVQGGAVPIIKLINRCEVARANTDKAVSLLMNLGADQQNRRTIREAGGVEALVALMKAAPLDVLLEHAMGALHNVMLTDTKAKMRAVDAGVAVGLARVLSAKLDENHMLAVRCRMLISDLLRVPDMQERLVAAANQLGVRIPGVMPGGSAPGSRRPTGQSGNSVISNASMQRAQERHLQEMAASALAAVSENDNDQAGDGEGEEDEEDEEEAGSVQG